MNDGFEKKLLGLIGAMRRPDPTAAWKAGILAAARREAEPIPMGRMLPPRLLMAAWAAAWAAIALLSFMSPPGRGRPAAGGVTREGAGVAAPVLFPADSTRIAFGRQYNTNADLP